MKIKTPEQAHRFVMQAQMGTLFVAAFSGGLLRDLQEIPPQTLSQAN
jgi:hypothetical protein